MKFQDDISMSHTHTHGQAETNISPTFFKVGGIITNSQTLFKKNPASTCSIVSGQVFFTSLCVD